jgi:hypothetical protein
VSVLVLVSSIAGVALSASTSGVTAEDDEKKLCDTTVVKFERIEDKTHANFLADIVSRD